MVTLADGFDFTAHRSWVKWMLRPLALSECFRSSTSLMLTRLPCDGRLLPESRGPSDHNSERPHTKRTEPRLKSRDRLLPIARSLSGLSDDLLQRRKGGPAYSAEYPRKLKLVRPLAKGQTTAVGWAFRQSAEGRHPA
jgi:hypothetical protein